jgi:hypothetical protein
MTTIGDNAVRLMAFGSLTVLGVYAMVTNNSMSATIIPMVMGGFLTAVGYEFQGQAAASATASVANATAAVPNGSVK